MGFLTNVSISNDFWHEIAKRPDRLVGAISIGMNEGVEGPVSDALSERDRLIGGRAFDRYVRNNTPQGVTVHRARHYDEPQVIVNAYGHHAIAAHEIPQAISLGWLEGNDYRRQHALKVAHELETLAERIRDGLDASV